VFMCLCVYVFMCLCVYVFIFSKGCFMSKKVNVSERAIIARIKRAIAKDDLLLCVCRENSNSFAELGRYYLVDGRSSVLITKHISLAGYAKEVGVLKPYEKIQKADD